jgi:hypothetical protein
MAVDQDDALAAADIVICKLHRESVERDRRRTPGYSPATADASADRGERAETPAAKELGAYEDRVKLAEQERSIGHLDQAPGAPVHWVSGAHDRQARRHTAPLLGTDDRGAQRGGYLIRAGRPADVLFRSGHRVAKGVKAFGHDSFRRDAQGKSDSDVGQGVVRAHPATATQSPLARVRHEASLGQPTYALPHGRL